MSDLLTYDSRGDTWLVSIAPERSSMELKSFEYAANYDSRDLDPKSIATLHARGEVVKTGGRDGIAKEALVEFRVALDTPLQVHRATVTSMSEFCSEFSNVNSDYSTITIDGVTIGEFDPTYVEPKGDSQRRAAVAIDAANAGLEQGPGEYPSIRNVLYHYSRLANWGTPTVTYPSPLRVLVASLCDDSLTEGEYTDASFDTTFASLVPEWEYPHYEEAEPNATTRRGAGIPKWAGIDWDSMGDFALDGDEFSPFPEGADFGEFM